MPKKVELVPHLSEAELKNRYRKAKDMVEARPWHLLWKVALGWTAKNSALAVGLDYDYARQIIRKYNKMGLRRFKITGTKMPKIGRKSTTPQ